MKRLEKFSKLPKKEKLKVLKKVNRKANQDQLKVWEDASNQIASNFCMQYFDTVDYFWVADEVGGILCVADHFFNMNDMIDYMKYEYPVDLMFERYEHGIKIYSLGGYPISIRDYIKLS